MMSGVSVAIIVLVLVVVVPVGVLVSGAVGAALLGWFLKADIDEAYEGTEHLEMGR
jgi:hypothetical protein